MTYFIAIQNTYSTLDIALFKNDRPIEKTIEDKTRASKNCIPIIAHMLDKHHLTLADLSFIAVNQGPGPFTTLRTVIASANGLGFASKLPLIGIDGLDAILAQHRSQYPNTVALLNAFNNDVYFGIQTTQSKQPIQKGYGNITHIISLIKSLIPDQPICFLGNGIELHKQEILTQWGDQAIMPDVQLETCSIDQIGLMGWEKWNKKEGLTNQLFPLYLKESMAHTKVQL